MQHQPRANRRKRSLKREPRRFPHHRRARAPEESRPRTAAKPLRTVANPTGKQHRPRRPSKRQRDSNHMATMSTSDLLDVFKNMTVLELNEFLKAFEEEFGVTAAAPVAVAAVGGGGGGAAEVAEE